jgi:hypothetical protein
LKGQIGECKHAKIVLKLGGHHDGA